MVAEDVDPAMVRLTSEAVAGLSNVRMIHREALAGKHVLAPEVLDMVRSGLAAGPDRTFKLVANLPYNVATPLIANLLVHPELCPRLMVVTIQREQADRLIARPSATAYGANSVLAQRWPRSRWSGAAALGLLAASQGRVGDHRRPTRRRSMHPRW